MPGAPGRIALVPASVTAALPPAPGGAPALSSGTFHDAVNYGPIAITGIARLTATVTSGNTVSHAWGFGGRSPTAAYSPNNSATRAYTRPCLHTATACNTAAIDADAAAITANQLQPTLWAISLLTLAQELSASRLCAARSPSAG
ncbi:MAG: hypothetical protein IT318_07365 [Anaerolineales bacterium]|nr:hypothetical protein [Anaerolineales bacterium]